MSGPAAMDNHIGNCYPDYAKVSLALARRDPIVRIPHHSRARSLGPPA